MKTKKGTGIFTKMIGIFGMLTLVIGALWVASLIFFYQRSDRASTAHSFANEIDIWMLQARRNEKDSQLRDIKTGDFYEKGTGTNIELHAKSMGELNKAIDRLEALHQVKKQSIDDLRAAVGEYGTSYTNLVAAYKQLGFQDWGAEGAWRVAAHDIEERLSATRNPALTISLLEIRRHEKDYLLRSDKTYLDQLTAEVGNLKAGVSRLGEPSRSALLADIDKYTSSVQNYVDLQNQIGLTENEGLQGTMRDAIHKVEPLVASVVDETRKLSQSQDAYRELLALDSRDHGGRAGCGWTRLCALRTYHLIAYPQGGRPAGEPGTRRPSGICWRRAFEKTRRGRTAGISAGNHVPEAA